MSLNNNTTFTGAQLLIEVLVKQGVDTVFGYPGGAVLNIYDELYKNSHRINHIITAHEQGAVHAADGYARTKDKVGVVISTSGPGATNLVTGIANAYLDSVPLVAITGNVATELLGKDSFQEVDIVGITKPIVKANYIVKDVRNLEHILNSAFITATTGRKGPVLVDIPKNIQLQQCQYKDITVYPYATDVPHTDKIVEAIKAHKKPYIYCGGGVISSNASEEVYKLSQKLSCPIGLSMMGLSAIRNSYKLNLGMCGMHGKYASSKAQSECDLLIAIGVRFSDRATGNVEHYSKNCTVIHIDIDFKEFNKNIPVDMQFCGNIKSILSSLLKDLEHDDYDYKNTNWLKNIEEWKKTDSLMMKGDFSPQHIIEKVNSFSSPNTIVATDVGQHQMWTMQYYKFEQPRTLLTSGGLGTMGYGLGAAIGGCIANNRSKTLLFTSDGSFGMNLNELATAVSQKLPIVIILLNNGVLGMVRQWQNMFYEQRYSQTTLDRKTDFTALSKAFGADGYKVTSLNELCDALSKTKTDTPCVIECIIDKDEKIFPMIPPGGTIDDIMLRS